MVEIRYFRGVQGCRYYYFAVEVCPHCGHSRDYRARVNSQGKFTHWDREDPGDSWALERYLYSADWQMVEITRLGLVMGNIPELTKAAIDKIHFTEKAD